MNIFRQLIALTTIFHDELHQHVWKKSCLFVIGDWLMIFRDCDSYQKQLDMEISD